MHDLGWPSSFSAMRRKDSWPGLTRGLSSPATTTAWNRSWKRTSRILLDFIPGVPSLSETSPIFRPIFLTLRRVGSASRKGGLFRSEEHTSELQSRFDLVCRLLLEKKKNKINK